MQAQGGDATRQYSRPRENVGAAFAGCRPAAQWASMEGRGAGGVPRRRLARAPVAVTRLLVPVPLAPLAHGSAGSHAAVVPRVTATVALPLGAVGVSPLMRVTGPVAAAVSVALPLAVVPGPSSPVALAAGVPFAFAVPFALPGTVSVSFLALLVVLVARAPVPVSVSVPLALLFTVSVSVPLVAPPLVTPAIAAVPFQFPVPVPTAAAAGATRPRVLWAVCVRPVAGQCVIESYGPRPHGRQSRHRRTAAHTREPAL
jgi:hypothetical protein